jgi:NAD(P)-dependent dehydrogenase (short-subunit alcohol dehydrogenase family)
MGGMMSTLAVAEDHCKGVDLSGRNIIITGASAGIGYESARVLAKCRANLYLFCRNKSKTDQAIAELKKETGNDQIFFIEACLDDFASVRKAAAEFKALNIPIHVLMLNAGVMVPPYAITKDGFETQWQTNHLSHFLLTMLLLDRLREGGSAESPSRVIAVASTAHAISPVNFDDINFERSGRMKMWRPYGQSKTANMLFALEFTKRYLATDHIAAFSLHPGVIQTELTRNMGFSGILFSAPGTQTIPQGAATQVYLAVAPFSKLIAGR